MYKTKINERLRQIEKNCLKLCEISYKHGITETQDIEQPLQLQELICSAYDKNEIIAKALAGLNNDTTSDINVIRQSFTNACEQNNNKNYKNCKQYKDFASQLNEIKVQAEAAKNLQNKDTAPMRTETDEFVMESEVNIYDPLTKLPMKYPVRNSICGHHYEKNSMLEAIELNPRLRCPVAGCGNKNHIKKNHLIPDQEFLQLLASLVVDDEND